MWGRRNSGRARKYVGRRVRPMDTYLADDYDELLPALMSDDGVLVRF